MKKWFISMALSVNITPIMAYGHVQNVPVDQPATESHQSSSPYDVAAHMAACDHGAQGDMAGGDMAVRGKACFDAGYFYLLRQNSQAAQPDDLKKSREYFIKSCDANHYSGCNRAAELFKYGAGGKIDRDKAEKLYGKSCDNGNAQGCYQLAVLFRQQGQGDTSLNFHQKSCDLGDGQGCSDAGLAYYHGQFTGINFDKARQYFEQSCNMHNGSGCANLAALYEKGQGAKQDIAMAMHYYSLSCDLGHQKICDYLHGLQAEQE